MKPSTLFIIAALGLFTVGAMVGSGQIRTPAEIKAVRTLPLEWERSTPLTTESAGVEWRGATYHLVRLISTQFKLDPKTGHLTAELKAGVTCFDDVDYEISAAVFDDTGELLGAARTACKVSRIWLGNVPVTPRTLDLDFGTSLDYPRATRFAIGISKCKVLTPADWQKNN